MPEGGNSYKYIEDVLWEKNRAIITLWVDSSYAEFCFVEFSGMNTKVYQNALTNDSNESNFIPLANGIYLRFRESLTSLDIYDFSDNTSPKWLNSANFNENEGIYDEDCQFFDTWWVYSENTFGILYKVTYEPEYGKSANVYWRVYSVNPTAEDPFTLIYEEVVHSLKSGTGVIEFDGKLYLSYWNTIDIITYPKTAE